MAVALCFGYFLLTSNSPVSVHDVTISQAQKLGNEDISNVAFVLQNNGAVRMKAVVLTEVGVNAVAGVNQAGRKIIAFQSISKTEDEIWVDAEKTRSVAIKVKLPPTEAYQIGTTGLLPRVTVKSTEKE